LTIPGTLEEYVPWKAVQKGAGLRFYVYADADRPKNGSKMVFKSAWVYHAHDADRSDRSAFSVLPQNELFTPGHHEDWESLGLGGGDFGKFAHYDEKGLIVDVPEKVGWGMTGIVLNHDKRFFLDERFEKIPVRFRLKVDPDQTDGFIVGLSTTGNKNRWLRPHDSRGIHFYREGNTGVMILFDSYRLKWVRRIPEELMESWDGWLDMTISKESMQACIFQTYCITAPITFSTRSKLYLMLATRPAEKNGKASMTLEEVTAQWMLPKMPEDASKWFYRSNEAFDPELFLNELTE
jgi:hypothetical protein